MFELYASPFSTRYGSDDMRRMWSEENRRLLMRRVWVALATAQYSASLLSAEQLADIANHAEDLDIERALAVEAETKHDVVAELRVFACQCPIGGDFIHWGATSADIVDNVDVLQQRAALGRIIAQLRVLLLALAERIDQTSHVVAMAHTHLQPAEPTTLGYRLALYAQDLLDDQVQLRAFHKQLRGKGFKGTVGTQAAFDDLLRFFEPNTGVRADRLEAVAMAYLGLPAFDIAGQTYPRRQDLCLASLLSGLAASLHKFALDFRILQSPSFGEWNEVRDEGYVGSSAMPHKRNPIDAENICSLARLVAAQVAVAWGNASQSMLERTLDDSANRRVFLPEMFLACEEMLRRATRLVGRIHFDVDRIDRNVDMYGPFASAQRVMLVIVGQGGQRQEVHEYLSYLATVAWQAVQVGQPNPLCDMLRDDAFVGEYLLPEALDDLLDFRQYVGTAASRAEALAAKIRHEEG